MTSKKTSKLIKIMDDIQNNIVIYQSGEVELKVSLSNETVWLRQNEIALLFEKDRSVITRHINKILKDKEVEAKSNVQKMHIANSDKPVVCPTLTGQN